MLVFLQKHEFDWQIPSQIVFSDDHMKTSPGHCGHFGHRDAWFQWDKSMISAKRVLWKIFECRVCQFSRPPRLWIDTRPSRMAIYVQMAIPNSISHTNSIRKRIPDRFSDFSVSAGHQIFDFNHSSMSPWFAHEISMFVLGSLSTISVVVISRFF